MNRKISLTSGLASFFPIYATGAILWRGYIFMVLFGSYILLWSVQSDFTNMFDNAYWGNSYYILDTVIVILSVGNLVLWVFSLKELYAFKRSGWSKFLIFFICQGLFYLFIDYQLIKGNAFVSMTDFYKNLDGYVFQYTVLPTIADAIYLSITFFYLFRIQKNFKWK